MKNNFTYPEMMDLLMKIQARVNMAKYPILNRDIDAVKKIYSQRLIKLRKDEITYQLSFQSFLNALEIYRIALPYYGDIYNVSTIAASAGQTLQYHASQRYLTEKESLKMEI